MDWERLYESDQLTEDGINWAENREANFSDTQTIEEKLKGLKAPDDFLKAYKNYLLDWESIYITAI